MKCVKCGAGRKEGCVYCSVCGNEAQIVSDYSVLEDDYLFGAVCNSTSVGGVMTLPSNQVDLRDGKFEVLLIRAPKTLQEISECLLAVQKGQYNCTMMTFRTASHILVEADPQMPWTLDGEKEEGHERVEIRNLHRAIQIIQKKEEEPDA